MGPSHRASQDDCVAPGGEGKPACSPLPGEMGLGGYYGHYQVRALVVATLLLLRPLPGARSPLRTPCYAAPTAPAAPAAPTTLSTLSTPSQHPVHSRHGRACRVRSHGTLAPNPNPNQGHWLSATAFLVNATGNATVAAAAARVVAVYAAVMEAWRARYAQHAAAQHAAVCGAPWRAHTLPPLAPSSSHHATRALWPRHTPNPIRLGLG